MRVQENESDTLEEARVNGVNNGRERKANMSIERGRFFDRLISKLITIGKPRHLCFVLINTWRQLSRDHAYADMLLATSSVVT